ncbi:MAG: transglutaminase domain-containing protein [Thermomicrobiales bacterium]
MQRIAIREGWAMVILSALLVYIAVLSVQRADWADGLGILTGVMLAGLVSGLIVSKWRQLPSAVLHLGGFVVGLLVVVYAMTRYLDDSIGGTRDKLRWLWERGEEWVRLLVNGEQAEDLYLFVLFITVLTFAMAYLTMWFIFRARWIWAALFFPGVVLLLNLGYSLRVPTGLLIAFLFVALLLLMRFTLLQREINWRRVRIDYPTTLMWRGLWAASYLALAVIIFGWAIPVNARSGTANDLWHDVDGPWRSVETQLNDWFVGLRGPGRSGVGGFAAFDDNFDLGGPLSLSDDPVVVVDAPGRSPYLQAHTYNIYTGRGWESDLTPPVEEGEPVVVPPQFELRPGESRPVDPSYAKDRERQSFDIQIERTRGNLLFSPGAFVSSDISTSLVVAWREVEEAVDVQTATPESIPADLWPFVSLLQTVDLTPDPVPTPTADEIAPTPEASPTPTPRPEPDYTKLPAQLAALRDDLLARDIQVSYTINTETYQVQTLNYRGQFPVLDDVEAVRSQDGLLEGDTYSVEAMVSDATGDDLRQATGEIPEEVLDRYLALPDSVTERTKALAEEVTRGQTNTYDIAKSLEEYLRSTIAYNENIEFPPEDVDVVDYVLFTSQEGYCEYYASSFIVMARSLGIPTRMSAGFFPTDDETDAGFVYRERNAHAWPEVYFPDYGWIAFEPTAARAAVDRDVTTPAGGTTSPIDERTGRLGEGAQSGALDDLNDLEFEEQNANLPTGTGAIGDTSSGPSTFDIALRVVPLVLLLLVLIVAYLWLRGTRGLSPSNQMYAKLARGASWGGIQSQAAMTPNEYAEQISGRVSGSRQPVTYLTSLYVQETYGNSRPTQTELLRARQAWLRLRGLFLRHFVSRFLFWRSNDQREYDEDDW